MLDQEPRKPTPIGRIRDWSKRVSKPIRLRRIGTWAVLLVIGLGAIVVGVMDLVDAKQYRSWSLTSGTIVESTRMADRGRGFFAVVRYEVDGNSYRTVSREGVQILRPEVGDVVEVRFDPADPSSAVLADEAGRWGLIRLGVGVALTLGTPVIMFRQMSWDSARAPDAEAPPEDMNVASRVWEDLFRHEYPKRGADGTGDDK